ncbi:putative membrane protein YeaQ/YmgE (transglycosylase-associated protein family) [Halarchaeum rubridurum]|uniref:Putative membrane protein YeaQ/YmgE (Transglycosylase-associated protein family) n=1 Tax=Halarchaeum rubridurum TaxID=489911 RepID=A0A830FSY7_9EURY|nr:hypothetical protein [Halarchaeum rubridurum]MBP1953997.1 putative membrane protein YeaQ/YmgE (transglycosylase-associated protein family) [Halarchaeum rubridurum]GGM56525.1 hypothetical protein GCM10009017_03360 [Halarchaeum rubridurum]
MRRLDLTAVFRAVLGCFVAAPVGYALAAPFAPPDPFTAIAYGLVGATLAGALGAAVAVRRALAPERLARALVVFYLGTFAALVAVQTLARATVGWIEGPWAGFAALLVGGLLAYALAFRGRA